MRRKEIANDTLRILEQGGYQSPEGRQIDLAADLRDCVDNTRYYEPAELGSIRDQVLSRSTEFGAMIFEAQNETTLQGAERLAVSGEFARIGVLNFASAKNPGGGFRTGAQAQEESLARSSGLYLSLLKAFSYYSYHRTHRSGLYSDRMIYSPRCPVFRRDDGELLERVYRVDFITSPAPNAGAIHRNAPEQVAKIESVLRERASKVLSLAVHHQCDVLILGAWGCGVFRNDPAMVAQVFGELLGANGLFGKRFRKILFSVFDTSQNQRAYQAFSELTIRMQWSE